LKTDGAFVSPTSRERNTSMPGHEIHFKIDKTNHTISEEQNPMSGAALRALPPAVSPDYDLWLRARGSEDDRVIEPTTTIVVESGMHFYTAKKVITPGERPVLRGANLLSDEDDAFLARKGWDCDVTAVQNPNGRQEVQIVVRAFPMPSKYRPGAVDLLVRQLPGYPEIGMDMFWTRPDVTEAGTGRKPHCCESVEHYQGVPWQRRWSRHISADQWRVGVDNLETFFGSIIKELAR